MRWPLLLIALAATAVVAGPAQAVCPVCQKQCLPPGGAPRPGETAAQCEARCAAALCPLPAGLLPVEPHPPPHLPPPHYTQGIAPKPHSHLHAAPAPKPEAGSAPILPPPLPAAIDGTPLPEPEAPVATRLFVNTIYTVPKDFGAVAALIFPGDAMDPARGRLVCSAFVGAMLPYGAVSKEHPHAQQMVTLWPVKKGSAALDPANADVDAAEADVRVCPEAVRDYDFGEAQQWRLRAASVDFGTGQGPFLVAWAPAADAGNPNVAFLFYDLSGFTTRSALAKAMAVWTREIEGNPAAWSHGWDLTRLRLALAAGADEYGAQIDAALKLIPWLGH